MGERSYGQYCGLAGALDLAGERWTLLVVRELMTGPKRYTDLQDRLRGVGTSLLASRLKKLEDHGIIIRRRMAPPAASTVYELSGSGEELAQALTPLMQWGLRHAVPEKPTRGMDVRADWALLGLTYGTDPAALADIDASYEFRISGSIAHLRIRGGKARIVTADEVPEPDATVTLDASIVAAIGSGRVHALDAVASGLIHLDGDESAIASLAQVLGTLSPA